MLVSRVDLFGGDFLTACEAQAPDVHEALVARLTWWKDVKTRRDPAAHRLPLYAPPGIMMIDDEARSQFAAIRDSGLSAIERYRQHSALEQQLGRFAPVFEELQPDGSARVRSILGTLIPDLDELISVVSGVVRAAKWI
jgi:hypothetical protein